MNRCDWAGCREPATTFEDGWWHCPTDLLLHREQTGTPPATTAERVAVLHREGLPDTAIAAGAQKGAEPPSAEVAS